MRRYWIEASQIVGNQVHFQGEVFHHIFEVCRQAEGSKFEVLAGDQKAHFVEVTNLSKKSATASIRETRTIPPLKNPRLRLAISIPRYPVMDAVIEKAVEMGVSSIHPFFSEFSFIRSGLPAGKLDRWQKIVVSATQQSGRGELLQVHPPQKFDELLSKINPKQQVQGQSIGIFAFEGQASLDIKTHLQARQRQSPEMPEEIWLFVGSEGGFSQTEVQSFHQAGLDSVTLGEQVLRVETACIALLAVLKYEFDLMR